jgi:molybdate transport system regulatory protein
MEVRLKIWLEENDQPVFGEGRRRLLECVHRHGSINQAAKELGQPYRKAWASLVTMEERLGFKLLDKRAGGDSGGGTQLTPEGLNFLNRYGLLMQELQLLARQKAEVLFHSRYAGSHNQAQEGE